MPRPQFTLRALLVATLVVGAFFGGREIGVRGERKRLTAESLTEGLRLQDEANKRAHEMDTMARQLFETQNRLRDEQARWDIERQASENPFHIPGE
jgi:hypothetical protein